MTWNYRIVKMKHYGNLINRLKIFVRELEEHSIKEPYDALAEILSVSETMDGEPIMSYGIHEVYYTEDGHPEGRTVKSIGLGSYEDAKELREALKLMLKDAETREVLIDKYPGEWGKEE